MADETTPAASPTGTPLIPPKVVAWLALAYAVAVAAIGTLASQHPEQPAYSLALQVVVALGAVLGLASPGLRSAAKVLVIGALAMNMTACAWLSKNAPIIQDVASAELAKCGPRALAAYSESRACFARPSFETCMGAVTVDIAVVKCAVDTYIAEREKLDASPAPVAALTSDVQPGDVPLARAKAWRAAHP